ncbi:SDR family oxidoreductase [Sorangium sp. So ce363]|uniref:SDR family oxidoreductase n=1 Tax=Sorangium sp. So ce363 TaxID=3133304 RepID=UPI003F5F2EA6
MACGGSLQYENRHVDVIRATNVEGTRRVLTLAGQLGAGTFNYISTAYVAGRATGSIPEAQSRGNATNNHYEQSKIDAETLVTSWANGRVRIFRPSIVVGHSRTLGATSFSGCYGFFRQLVQFRGMIERTQKGLLSRSPVRMRVHPDGDLNVVPVDAVVQEAVAIALQDACEGVFHLTHPFPWKTGATVRAMFELLGMHAPIFIDRRDDFSWLDQQLDKRMDFYGSYIIGHKHFERIRTDAALRGCERFAYAEVPLVELCQWYFQVLEETQVFGFLAHRFGKRAWVERSGGSLRLVRRLIKNFPDARFVHLVRDGRTCAISMSRHLGFRMALIAVQLTEILGVDPWESRDRAYVDDVPEELLPFLPERFDREAFLRYETPLPLCGHYWSGEIVTGLDELSGVAPGRLLTLRYEDFGQAPRPTIARLMEFIGVDVDDVWIERMAGIVRPARSRFSELAPGERRALMEACQPGFAALAELYSDEIAEAALDEAPI